MDKAVRPRLSPRQPTGASETVSVTTFTNVNGQMLCQSKDGVVSHFISDPLGSIVLVRDGAGSKVYEAEYDPYGNIQSEAGTNPSGFGFVGTLGYVKDSNRALYGRSRFLETNLGRWLSRNPMWPSEPGFVFSVRFAPIGFHGPAGVETALPSVIPKPGIGPKPTPWPTGGGGGGAINVVGIVVAIGDLIWWSCPGQTGPFTGIGKGIGEFYFPYPQGDRISDDRVERCRDRCVQRWAGSGHVWGSKIISDACKRRSTERPRRWLTDCNGMCHENCKATVSMLGEKDSAYREKCGIRWAK